MKFFYFILLLPLFAFSQVTVDINSGNPAFPFPQFLAYESDSHSLGNLATQNAPGVTHAEMEQTIRDAWQIMANRFEYTGDVVSGVRLIKANIGCPYDCTEGDGYALLAAAEMGDKTTFDGVWFRTHDLRLRTQPKYSDCIPNEPDYPWGRFTLKDNNDSAADGDYDVALALVIAAKQWGEDSGHVDACGNIINYKEEALKVVRGIVEKVEGSTGQGHILTGSIGIDGYFKGGNTWMELTSWVAPSGDVPQYPGPRNQFTDYMAPSYYNAFADFLEKEGDNDDLDWNIPQFLRAEASSDWLMGKLYESSPTAVPTAGQVNLADETNPIFMTNLDGGDFRNAWRTILNYVWHGDPTTTWNPVTHQVESGGNTYEKDMGVRFANYMNDPSEAPWSNVCSAVGGGPGLTYSGPSQLKYWIDSNSGEELSAFNLNWVPGVGATSAVAAQDYDLMGKLYRQCVIEWDTTSAGDGYLTSVPGYFHGFFRLLGMLTATGNHHSPSEIELQSNLKVYHKLDKTFAFTDDELVYTISYRNYASVDAENVEISTVLPEGLSFVSASNGGTNSGNAVSWNIGSVPGFKTATGVEGASGQVTMTVKVDSGFSGRICNEFEITTSNGKGWVSNEYPNEETPIMQRNCVDIVEKALEITKTVNHDEVNPGNVLTYEVDFENASSGGFINGGRPDVIVAYAHDGHEAEAATNLIKIRLYHGAAEPYIDYGNYRISMFLNDNGATCVAGEEGCTGTAWALDDNTYEGGDKEAVLITSEKIVPGSDDRGSWNQRVIVKFSEQLATITPHISRYYGLVGGRVHQGGAEPLRAIWQMHNTQFSSVNWGDDWSWNPQASDSDGGLYYPVTNDFTDPFNPDIPVTVYHNEACETPTYTVDNILVEEWDGYTWRRAYGNSPVPGRETENVIVKDVLPEGFIFVGFVDDNGVDLGNSTTILGEPVTYDEDTRTITWTKSILQVREGGGFKYQAIANFSSGTCSRADEEQVNTASIEADNESPVIAEVTVNITCEPVILPPAESSMVKEVSPISAEVGEEVVYTLSYKNTDGSPFQSDFSEGWTVREGSAYNIDATGISNVANAVQISTNNLSHGLNGIIEATIDFNDNAQFGIALRYDGDLTTTGIENGYYLVFKPNSGSGNVGTTLYNGTTEVSTDGDSLKISSDLEGNVKIELIGDQINIWMGDTTSPIPSLTFNGIEERVGYTGFINGSPLGADNYGVHKVTSFYSAMDSAFNLQIIDPIPGELAFVSSAEGELIDGTVHFPLQEGPILADEEFSYTWTAEIVSCPSDLQAIENIAYTNIFGIPENSIAAQAILDCSGADLCGELPEIPTLTEGDEILVCSGDAAEINAEDYVEITSPDFELIWFDGPSKFDDEIDAPTVDTDTEGEITYYVAQIEDIVCGEGDRIALTFVVGNGAEGVTEEITIESGDSVDFDIISEIGYTPGEVQWVATENPDVDGESTSAIINDSVNDVLTNTSTTEQIVEYSIEEISAGECSRGISTLIVTVLPTSSCLTEAPEVATVEYCLNEVLTDTLESYVTAEGTLLWYADNDLASTAITMPTIDTSIAGETSYYVSQVVDDCESERVEIIIKEKDASGEIIEYTEVILSEDSLAFDIIAETGLETGSFEWSASTNANVTGQTEAISSETVITDTLTNISDSNQEVVYTITPFSCNEPTHVLTVTVLSPSSCLTEAPEVETVEYCLNEVLTDSLETYVTAEGTLLWYANNDLASTAITMPTIDTSVAGETSYFVSQVIDDCESIRVEITLVGNEANNEVVQHTEVILSNETLAFDIFNETGLTEGNYEWSASVNSSVTGQTVAPSNEPIIADTLVNDSNFDHQIFYTITPFDCNEPTHRLSVTIRTIPSVEIDTSAIVEGDDLQIELIFSKPTVSESTIEIGISPGAVNGVSADDISLDDIILVIPVGSENYILTIPTIDDNLSEPSENIEISIKNVDPENITIPTGVTEVAIIDNDGLPSILIDDIEILEGETKAVDIRLSNPSSEDITITVSLIFTNDTTTDGDFELLDTGSITVSFEAGEVEPTNQTNIMAIDDSIPEGDQVLIVSVDTVDNGVLNDSSDTAEITIIDDDLAPTVLIDDAQVIEGNIIEIPIYLRTPALDRIELLVGFTDVDTDGDFDTSSRTVVFEPGARVPTTPLEVEILQDTLVETDEDFIVNIQSVVEGIVNFGGFIGLDSGIITIQDDDVEPEIIISNLVLEEGDSRDINIELSSPAVDDITLTLNIANITASDDDYLITTQEVTFSSGNTLPNGSITIEALEDELLENNETVQISIASVDSGSVSDFSDTATITIEDTTIEVIEAPECTEITSPADGASGIGLRPIIRWEAVVGADGYLLSVGTTPNGSDIVETVDVGANLSYFISSALEELSTYYVEVIPYNEGGEALDCDSAISFDTEDAIEVSRTKYGISPDGDGINEFWQIDNIEEYPDNEVYVYNRWGSLVFRIKNYDNNFNVFTGEANEKTNLGAGELLSGTYFYEIKINGEHDFTDLKGFLVLKR